MRDFDRLSHEADAAGFRLEVVHGVPVWEAFPLVRHQRASVRIINSVRPIAVDGSPCKCIALPDVQIRFPDGSRKRPDVAIFCEEPEEDTEVTVIPGAVIEIISKDYEGKDLIIGVPFYQQVGIRDIVVLDPVSGAVRHWQMGFGEQSYQSPVNLTFLCGCVCVV